MKTRSLLLLLLTIMLISSCSKYAYVNLSYPLEPKKQLPETINEIAVVNRSLTTEDNQDEKILEAVVTGEVAGSDKRASDEAIKGVFSAGQSWHGKVIVIPDTTRLEGTGTRKVPELLNWNLVSDICKKEHTDALLVLENFDSNTDIFIEAAKEQVAAILATGKPVAKSPGKMNMNVSCYWRMYEPTSRTIVDQYQHNSYMTFHLINGIPPPNALKETAYNAGIEYVERFLPSYYTVRRRLYKRTKGPAKYAFRAAVRKSEVANWEGAIEQWKDLADNPKRKTAGRACLNVAVGYEVLRNTGEALNWARRSYEQYGDKLGRDYSKILNRRSNIEGL